MPGILPFPFVVDVPLREKRTYLHSTNLFDFLVQRTGASRNISLLFRRKIECQAHVLPAEGCSDPESFPARFAGEGAGGKVDLVIAEMLPPVSIGWREPYDEGAAAAGSEIDGSCIYSGQQNGASTIERIVALNKQLLTRQTQGQRVLVFSRISIVRLPEGEAMLKICLKSRLGLKLFRSSISADGEELGEIVFYGT